MNDYDNTNRGVLFKNDRKREGKRDPDYTGTITLANGDEHWLSCWNNKSQSGRPYLSLSIGPLKEPNQQQSAPAQQRMPAPAPDNNPDFDDDIPF